jgi:hypothetical protein
MDSQQRSSDGQVEVVDHDEVPPQYQVERHTSELGRTRGRVLSGNVPPPRNKRSTQCTLTFHRTKRRVDD